MIRQLIPSLKSSPLRFDFGCSPQPGCIVAEAGPRPVFGLLNESPRDRVAMHVAQLFDALFIAQTLKS
jgi:hypothetical protein